MDSFRFFPDWSTTVLSCRSLFCKEIDEPRLQGGCISIFESPSQGRPSSLHCPPDFPVRCFCFPTRRRGNNQRSLEISPESAANPHIFTAIRSKAQDSVAQVSKPAVSPIFQIGRARGWQRRRRVQRPTIRVTWKSALQDRL
jgi:hypothetical protein